MKEEGRDGGNEDKREKVGGIGDGGRRGAIKGRMDGKRKRKVDK